MTLHCNHFIYYEEILEPVGKIHLSGYSEKYKYIHMKYVTFEMNIYLIRLE